MKKKKVSSTLTLVVPAGKANPAPPIGPALGPRGVPAMKFCQEFNAYTEAHKIPAGTPVPARITIYEDRSYTFVVGTPPASYLLKRAAGLDSGSKKPGSEKAGTVSMVQVKEIALQKMEDMRLDPADPAQLDAAMKTIMGTALSAGIAVSE